MDSDLETEKQFKIDQALSDVKAKYEIERDNLVSKHNMKVQEFASSYNGLDFEDKQAELVSMQQVELAHLEQLFLEDCDKLKSSITAELETKHAYDKIALSERHYQVSPIEI